MKLPPDLLRTGVLRIDWSGFSRILECHRKAWHLLCHRRELDGYTAALTYGSAIHAGLDTWQQHLMRGSTDRPEILTAMEASAAEVFDGIEVPESEWRTLGRAKETLGLYADARWDEDRGFKILETEKYHERPLGTINPRGLREIQVIWQGKIDGVWQDPRNGAKIIKDSKTSSKQFELHGPLGGDGRDIVRYRRAASSRATASSPKAPQLSLTSSPGSPHSSVSPPNPHRATHSTDKSSSGPPSRSPSGSTAPSIRSNSGSRPSPSMTPRSSSTPPPAPPSAFVPTTQPANRRPKRCASVGSPADASATTLWDPSSKEEA
jgi:hypothetical protein